MVAQVLDVLNLTLTAYLSTVRLGNHLPCMGGNNESKVFGAQSGTGKVSKGHSVILVAFTPRT